AASSNSSSRAPEPNPPISTGLTEGNHEPGFPCEPTTAVGISGRVICSGVLEHGADRGWPEKGASAGGASSHSRGGTGRVRRRRARGPEKGASAGGASRHSRGGTGRVRRRRARVAEKGASAGGASRHSRGGPGGVGRRRAGG